MIQIQDIVLFLTLASGAAVQTPAVPRTQSPPKPPASAQAIVVEGTWETARGGVHPGMSLRAGDIVTTKDSPARLEVMLVDGKWMPSCRNGQGAACTRIVIPAASPASFLTRVIWAIDQLLSKDPGRLVPAAPRGTSEFETESVVAAGTWRVDVNMKDATAKIMAIRGEPPAPCRAEPKGQTTTIVCTTRPGLYQLVVSPAAHPASKAFHWVSVVCDAPAATQVASDRDAIIARLFPEKGTDRGTARTILARVMLMQAADEALQACAGKSQ